MSYKRRYMKERYVTRKLRRDIYSRLEALCKDRELNECLEELLDRAERCTSTVDMSTISTVDIRPMSTVDTPAIGAKQPRQLKVRVEPVVNGYFSGYWRIHVGEGYDTEVFALPRAVLERMCRAGLLHPDICEDLHKAIARATSSTV